MPKAEVGSLKDIGKRIKSKGLQKLKFFCQMCQKQCRDANGFQCHLTSDSHLRQMKLFSENASGYMDQFSRDFETSFLETLRRRHGPGTLVNANNVYQQVIQDKVHVHMNATQWTSLSDFCKYLGKTGKCKVEQNERGWFLRFIERDASKLARQEALDKRLAAEQLAEDELHTRIQQQRLAAAQAHAEDQLAPTELKVDGTTSNTAAAVSLNLQKSLLGVGAATAKSHKKSKSSSSKDVASLLDDSDDDDNDAVNEKGPASYVPESAVAGKAANVDGRKQSRQHPLEDHRTATTTTNSKTVTLDTGRSDDNQRKRPPGENDQEKRPGEVKKARHTQDNDNNDDKDGSVAAQAAAAVPWLYRDIVVRIINKDLQQGRYFKRKAVVDRVFLNRDNSHSKDDTGPSFAAELTILPNEKKTRGDQDDDSVVGDVVRLDQDDLETVIPKPNDLLDEQDTHDDDDKNKKKHKNKKIRVCIIRGKHAGKKAKVLQLDKSRQQARLELKEDGAILKHVDYEDFSKIM
jgi:DNA/RNA-binding protein KIN17